MRKLLFALAVLLIAAPAFATADTSKATITHVFVQKMGSASVNVLRLRSDKTYEYCRYTKKKINRDYGSYVLTKRTLELTTELKKGVVNPLLHKTLYVSSKGLHKTRMDAVRKKAALVSLSDSPEYQKSWLFNPVTKTEQYVSDKANVATDAPPAIAVTPVKPALTTSVKTVAPPSNAGELAKQYFIKTASIYSPGYDKMLSNAYCGPDCYTSSVNGSIVEWSKDTSALALFSDYETVIHESTHHYNGSEYLVIPGVSIPVTRSGEVYTSSEFAEIVPKEASNKIFRYDTYVGKNSVVSANVSGIYGMLDEYSAYCNGVRSCLIGARTAAAKKDTALALRFLSQASGTYEANLEFRLFIAWYLHYANLKHPDQYKALMANNNLRVAFTLIDHEFKKTVLALNDEASRLGYWGNFDTDYYSGVYTKYIPGLLKNEQVWVEQFSVKNVTTENYKEYLRSDS